MRARFMTTMLSILLVVGATGVAAQTLATFAVPGAVDTYASGVNASGDIVGSYVMNGTHAYLQQHGLFVTIDPPGATWAIASGINAPGAVVGTATVGGTTMGFLRSRGAYNLVTYPGASATYFTDINERGQVTGFAQTASGWTPFVWYRGNFTDLECPFGYGCHPTGINPRGDVVGYYFFSGDDYQGFLRNKFDEWEVLEVPAWRVEALGIGPQGVIVGFMGGSKDWGSGFLMVDGVITTIECPDNKLTYAEGVSANGTIVGSCQSSVDNSWKGFILTPQ